MNEKTVTPSQSNAMLWKSKTYSDLVIECGGYPFQARRGIVFTQSGLLERRCEDLLPGSLQAIEVASEEGFMEKDFMEQALTYMYTGDYDDSVRDTFSHKNGAKKDNTTRNKTRTQADDAMVSDTEHSPRKFGGDTMDPPTMTVHKALIFNTGTYLAAYRLQIMSLKNAACKKIENYFIHTELDQDWEFFADSVELLYTNMPIFTQRATKQLRNILVSKAVEQYSAFVISDSFTRVTILCPEFVATFTKKLSNALGRDESFEAERDDALQELAEAQAELKIARKNLVQEKAAQKRLPASDKDHKADTS
ncbi:uncharacterized protein RAG0_08059 [Rhynchosporium agropyri]|uniref:BTB domain-containing protein n=1 Tax=Rhynchosporium agropyri TaxID=914238 RepID=A0A1E1KNZ5_9HELO|nr:uncharacterized protein RAG0_08059 [Rhynchosporium agropyri]